ncbi:MAG: purine-nucleoside phosphorylase [Bdellovibrionaceae bacterium]|nr:purine-nucleoside phosphorylase [Pseudobdellovibrionaceae bacterium]|tara:strand:+ start:163 stop:1011 length:849 start_codon:yes stop_codon:yes gene_type:complete
MQGPSIYEKIRAAVSEIQSRSSIQPKIGMILGSGLGPIADQCTDAVKLNYSDIPYFHGTSVEGHAGKMILGNFEGVPVVFLQGRFHVYEGYPMEDVVLPTRVLCALGIETLILTNAAGGINTRFQPCDLMVIRDHINLMGNNPLKGPNLSELGPRFPDMTEAYDSKCIEILKNTAAEINLPLQEGVYAGVLGPTYETPAEVRMLRTLGADAVGMSTVPESIAANHLGVQVVGISAITNLAAGISHQKLTHEEVMESSELTAKKMTSLLKNAIPRLVHERGNE